MSKNTDYWGLLLRVIEKTNQFSPIVVASDNQHQNHTKFSRTATSQKKKKKKKMIMIKKVLLALRRLHISFHKIH